MSTYYLPKERCTLEQAIKNSEIRGIEIINVQKTVYRCEGFGAKACISIENGWVRGGWQYGPNDAETVQFILSQVSNCDWTSEYGEEFFAYLNWDEKERFLSAREAADDVIENAKMEGYTLTKQEAIKDELHYELSERERFGIGDTLPLANAVKEFELYAPIISCRIEEVLENAEQAGIYTDFHQSGKVDFSFGPLTDEQGPVTLEPVVTALIEEGFVKDAAVYEWAASKSHETLQAMTKCAWY